MAQPTISSNYGIHKITFPDEMIDVQVDHINEDARTHKIEGEVNFRTRLPGMKPHLHRAKLNMTSTQSHDKLASFLEKRVPAIDWYAIVETTCMMVVDEVRKGEPVYDLAKIDYQASLRWRLAPLLYDGKPNLIFGPGGISKSFLALYFATLIDLGLTEENGFSAEPGKCLILDYEGDSVESAERYAMIMNGMGMAPAERSILYRFCHAPLSADLPLIQRQVLESNIEFIVVDSAAGACGGEPESAERAIKFFNALRSLRITTLTIAHTSKQGGGKRGPFGSVYWQNAPRNVLEVIKDQDEDEDSLTVGLYHRKTNSGRLRTPIGLNLSFKKDSLTIKRDDNSLHDKPETAKNISLKQRLIKVLSGGEQTTGYLAEELDTTENTITTKLYSEWTGKDGRQKGIFVKTGKGTWGLATQANQLL